mgnify:CR=1 FL=1
MERTRVIIADDESLIRMDLREMLTKNIRQNLQIAVQVERELHRPAVVVLADPVVVELAVVEPGHAPHQGDLPALPVLDPGHGICVFRVVKGDPFHPSLDLGFVLVSQAPSP